MPERIETTLDQRYFRTSDQPTSFQYAMLADKELDYDWERDGEPVIYTIMNAADIPEEPASDIQGILEDNFFDFDAAAVDCDPIPYSLIWIRVALLTFKMR